jgi:hypothetical protein
MERSPPPADTNNRHSDGKEDVFLAGKFLAHMNENVEFQVEFGEGFPIHLLSWGDIAMGSRETSDVRVERISPGTCKKMTVSSTEYSTSGVALPKFNLWNDVHYFENKATAEHIAAEAAFVMQKITEVSNMVIRLPGYREPSKGKETYWTEAILQLWIVEGYQDRYRMRRESEFEKKRDRLDLVVSVRRADCGSEIRPQMVDYVVIAEYKCYSEQESTGQSITSAGNQMTRYLNAALSSQQTLRPVAMMFVYSVNRKVTIRPNGATTNSLRQVHSSFWPVKRAIYSRETRHDSQRYYLKPRKYVPKSSSFPGHPINPRSPGGGGDDDDDDEDDDNGGRNGHKSLSPKRGKQPPKRDRQERQTGDGGGASAKSSAINPVSGGKGRKEGRRAFGGEHKRGKIVEEETEQDPDDMNDANGGSSRGGGGGRSREKSREGRGNSRGKKPAGEMTDEEMEEDRGGRSREKSREGRGNPRAQKPVGEMADEEMEEDQAFDDFEEGEMVDEDQNNFSIGSDGESAQEFDPGDPEDPEHEKDYIEIRDNDKPANRDLQKYIKETDFGKNESHGMRPDTLKGILYDKSTIVLRQNRDWFILRKHLPFPFRRIYGGERMLHMELNSNMSFMHRFCAIQVRDPPEADGTMGRRLWNGRWRLGRVTEVYMTPEHLKFRILLPGPQHKQNKLEKGVVTVEIPWEQTADAWRCVEADPEFGTFSVKAGLQSVRDKDAEKMLESDSLDFLADICMFTTLALDMKESHSMLSNKIKTMERNQTIAREGMKNYYAEFLQENRNSQQESWVTAKILGLESLLKIEERALEDEETKTRSLTSEIETNKTNFKTLSTKRDQELQNALELDIQQKVAIQLLEDKVLTLSEGGSSVRASNSSPEGTKKTVRTWFKSANGVAEKDTDYTALKDQIQRLQQELKRERAASRTNQAKLETRLTERFNNDLERQARRLKSRFEEELKSERGQQLTERGKQLTDLDQNIAKVKDLEARLKTIDWTGPKQPEETDRAGQGNSEIAQGEVSPRSPAGGSAQRSSERVTGVPADADDYEWWHEIVRARAASDAAESEERASGQ